MTQIRSNFSYFLWLQSENQWNLGSNWMSRGMNPSKWIDQYQINLSYTNIFSTRCFLFRCHKSVRSGLWTPQKASMFTSIVLFFFSLLVHLLLKPKHEHANDDFQKKNTQKKSKNSCAWRLIFMRSSFRMI